MNSYIAVVFSSDDKAHQALRKRWQFDQEGRLTAHGAAVPRRDESGHIRVADRDSDLGMRTAIGAGVQATSSMPWTPTTQGPKSASLKT